MFENLETRVQNFLNTRTGFLVAIAAMAFSVYILAVRVRDHYRNRNVY